MVKLESRTEELFALTAIFYQTEIFTVLFFVKLSLKNFAKCVSPEKKVGLKENEGVSSMHRRLRAAVNRLHIGMSLPK